jgi:hypothetical protein
MGIDHVKVVFRGLRELGFLVGWLEFLEYTGEK